jgi:hypothetical protein
MFRWLVVPAVLVLCLFVATDGSTGEKKKKKAPTLTGIVLSVEPAKDAKDEGTITFKTADKKKKGQVIEAGKEVRVTVNKETKFEKAGEKKKDPATPATFADVQKDQTITATLRDNATNVAVKVRIHYPKKKDKGAGAGAVKA